MVGEQVDHRIRLHVVLSLKAPVVDAGVAASIGGRPVVQVTVDTCGEVCHTQEGQRGYKWGMVSGDLELFFDSQAESQRLEVEGWSLNRLEHLDLQRICHQRLSGISISILFLFKVYLIRPSLK